MDQGMALAAAQTQTSGPGFQAGYLLSWLLATLFSMLLSQHMNHLSLHFTTLYSLTIIVPNCPAPEALGGLMGEILLTPSLEMWGRVVLVIGSLKATHFLLTAE